MYSIKSFILKFTPSRVLSLYHFLWALWGAVRWWFPSHQLTVIGVTGTNGKSTVVRMVHAMLRSAGISVSAHSTVEQIIGDTQMLNSEKQTMPGRGALQRFLRRSVRAGCRVVVVEVTSEGVLQHRHRFIDWNIVAVTNLAPEHIEHHGSFEAYRSAKTLFFREALSSGGVAIVNADDSSAPHFVRAADGAMVVCTTIQQQPEKPCEHTVQASNIQDTAEGQEFFVDDQRFVVPLLGRFNVANALTALAIAQQVDVSVSSAANALIAVKSIPGRMEEVVSDPIRVMVDYAHTPDALENVYAALHDPGDHPVDSDGYVDLERNRLICVLGAAGGGRDRWKRPEFGKIASDYCDYIILTDEDPYDEDSQQIVDDIMQGFHQSKMQTPLHRVILDRREAIRTALHEARSSDTVVITGKGSEPKMMLAKGRSIPWDDRTVIREEWKRVKEKTHGRVES